MSGGSGVEVLRASDAEQAQRRAAGALVGAGLGPGDRVAFCLPSSAGLLCAVLGALRIGIVPVLLNATLLDAERDDLVEDSAAALAITDAPSLARLDRGPAVALAPCPLARPMHYTSGTTGRAKGVWSGLWNEPTAAAALADEADQWSFGSEDVHLVCSPMYHSVSVRFAGGTLLTGGTCVILDHFDAEVAAAALDGAMGPVPTTTFLAPSALTRLLALPDSSPDRFARLRLLVHAGSPCPPALKWAALDMVGPGVLWEFYGSTEGQFTVCSPEEWVQRPGTVGRARAGRILTVDGDGMVWCRPPDFGRFTYWNDDDKTSAAWRDGSFTVGDLGRLDDEGYLYLDGRRDDLVITGGVNVYPAEVEAALSEVPGVEEVAVFGLADEEWGQRVCAAVVSTGTSGDDELLVALRAHAAARLAGYKRPKQYEIVGALPRTATGKIRRLALGEVVGPGGEAGAGGRYWTP
ncbi:MAG: AMP-binding protein [Acidimicrobiales bacterium]|jgi:acyl-CoA synthetase (AMP-forming)/AMP-acid ligase II